MDSAADPSFRWVQGEPSYLSWPVFQDMTVAAHHQGKRVFWNLTALLVGDLEVTHDECMTQPDDVVAIVLRYLRQSDRSIQISRNEDQFGVTPVSAPGTLPGQEYTRGGQHISERSG